MNVRDRFDGNGCMTVNLTLTVNSDFDLGLRDMSGTGPAV